MSYSDVMESITDRQQQLGRRIKQRRVEAGYTQRELALIIETSQSYLWKLEAGRLNASVVTLCRIADALDTTVNDLIEF